MKKKIKLGDYVKLVELPEWLIHDLPDDEKAQIVSYIGKTAVITEIDNYGYYWLGFGVVTEGAVNASYIGHSFCVTDDCLKLVSSSRMTD